MQTGSGAEGFVADPPELLEEPELELEPVDGLEALLEPDDVELPVLGFAVLLGADDPDPVEGLAAVLVPELLDAELLLTVLDEFVLLELEELPVFLLAELFETELDFVAEELLEEDSLLLSVSVSASSLPSVTLTLKELFAVLPEESTAVIETV